eukprot:7405313-Alexandrium_andersonii.AAC.1
MLVAAGRAAATTHGCAGLLLSATAAAAQLQWMHTAAGRSSDASLQGRDLPRAIAGRWLLPSTAWDMHVAHTVAYL